MNIAEAKVRLDDLASDCENENYHSEAGVIWGVMDDLDTITKPTLIWVATSNGMEKLEVTP